MWYVLLAILIVICLFQNAEPFQNKSSPKEDLKPTQDKPDKPRTRHEQVPYVQRHYVGLKEPLDSRLKCPTYYEDINKDILVEYQKISEAAYGYTPNRYLDVTRFLDFSKLKEPLPINPDFFIQFK